MLESIVSMPNSVAKSSVVVYVRLVCLECTWWRSLVGVRWGSGAAQLGSIYKPQFNGVEIISVFETESWLPAPPSCGHYGVGINRDPRFGNKKNPSFDKRD